MPRTEPERGVSLPVLLFNVLLTAGFWAVAVAAVRSGDEGGVIGGALIGMLAAVLTMASLANVAMRRWPRGLHPPRLARRGEEQGVHLRAWTPAVYAAPLITGLAGVAASVLGLGGVVGGVRWFGAMLLPGLYLLWLTAAMLLGRYPLRQDVWLTPTRLAVSYDMVVGELTWDEVEGASEVGTRTMVLARVVPRGHRATLAGLRKPLEHPFLQVGNARICVPPRGLAELVGLYAAHPGMRAELAGDDGLRRVTRAAYETQGGTADPAQHPARQPR